MKKKILMIGTGGTISSRDEGQGLSPGMQVEELMKYCPRIKELCDVECIQPILSQNSKSPSKNVPKVNIGLNF